MEQTGTTGALRPMPQEPPAGASVVLKVGKKLLWVGAAAYPLHNITRVHTFELKPRRAEAVLSFLKWSGITVAACIALGAAGGQSSYDDRVDEGSGTGPLLLAATVVIVLFTLMVKECISPSHHVLAVETSGVSTALVTLPNPEQLRQLVHYLVNAIENPDAEFQVQVERVLVNPKNYHFGDQVNMYGGLGNTGVSK
ncbi:DUF6232 family protein [Streptomyces sp. NPDC002911]